MLYGHSRVRWIQNKLQIEQHYRDSVSSISSVKNSPANTIKLSAAIFNLVSFSLCVACERAHFWVTRASATNIKAIRREGVWWRGASPLDFELAATPCALVFQLEHTRSLWSLKTIGNEVCFRIENHENNWDCCAFLVQFSWIYPKSILAKKGKISKTELGKNTPRVCIPDFVQSWFH